jgi:hypothetical protein
VGIGFFFFCMMQQLWKLDPLRAGIGFFFLHGTHPRSCAAPPSRRAAHHQPCLTRCLRVLVWRHALIASARFSIARPPWGVPFSHSCKPAASPMQKLRHHHILDRALGFVPDSENRSGRPHKRRE